MTDDELRALARGLSRVLRPVADRYRETAARQNMALVVDAPHDYGGLGLFVTWPSWNCRYTEVTPFCRRGDPFQYKYEIDASDLADCLEEARDEGLPVLVDLAEALIALAEEIPRAVAELDEDPPPPDQGRLQESLDALRALADAANLSD